MHGATVGSAGKAGAWWWTVEETARSSWQEVPWEHDVLVTVEDLGDGSLDALFEKARQTARRRRRVLVLLATQKGRKELGEIPGATLCRCTSQRAACRGATLSAGPTCRAAERGTTAARSRRTRRRSTRTACRRWRQAQARRWRRSSGTRS